MPNGYYLSNGTKNKGWFGNFPNGPLFTLEQAQTSIKNDEYLKGFRPVPLEGDYVGCQDCPFQTESRANGCWEPGITSDNCRRTKER
jgi:hypothetical protein